MRVLLRNSEKCEIFEYCDIDQTPNIFCQNYLIDRLHHLLSGRLHLHLNAMGLTCEGLLMYFRTHFFLVFEFSKISSVGFCQVSVMPYLPFVSNIHQRVFLGMSKEQWLVIRLMYHFRNKFWCQLLRQILVYQDHSRRQFFGSLTDACGQK